MCIFFTVRLEMRDSEKRENMRKVSYHTYPCESTCKYYSISENQREYLRFILQTWFNRSIHP